MQDKKQKNVFVVFEKRQLSCDRDYGEDGFMIIWDSDELGRNMTTENLSKEIKKLDDELHDNLIKFMQEELQLNDFGMADDYMTEIMEFLTEQTNGMMYMFYYQEISVIKEVHALEESAKKAVVYYTNNNSYQNGFYYSKHRLLGIEN